MPGAPSLLAAAPAVSTASSRLLALQPTAVPAVAGETKSVTVLAGRVHQAAALAARLDPEALHHTMRAFFALVHAEVQRYGGTLQRRLDDGFVALFGAPVAQEDHARRAVLAALGVQQRLRDHGTDAGLALGAPLAVGLGLHTGRVLVGPLADDGELTYTPLGDTARLAMRLAQQAPPGAIRLSAATQRLVQDAVRVEACTPVRSARIHHPTSGYTVLGLASQRAPFRTVGAQPGSPFVGRQHELAVLHERVAQVAAGHGQVVGIVGEPGIGKSRLLDEWCRGLSEGQVTHLAARCVSYGTATPYRPVLDLLSDLWAVADADALDTISAKVTRGLQDTGMDAEEAGPYLWSLLGVPEATPRLATLSPQVLRTRTFATLHRLYRSISQQRPLLLEVGDVHWIDPTSQEYLGELVDQMAGVPILLLVTFRPGYQPPWMDKSYATQLALPPLGPADGRRVVQAILGAEPMPEPLLHAILAKAEGNPFFLEELARAVREHGEQHLPTQVPDTVQAVLAARMDRLPPEAKHLLQVAAVIGPEVPLALLQAITTVPADTLRMSLRHLQSAAFLLVTHSEPDLIYAFKHALTRDVAYESLLQERRRVLHAQIVAALETLAGDRRDEQVERLAHHALRGEVWDKALLYCRQAGTKAFARSAHREAVACLEQALEALTHLPPDRPRLEQAIDLRCDLYSALTPFAQEDRRLAYLREAETLAEGLADQRRLGLVYRNIADILWLMQDYEPALAYCQRAHAIGRALGDVALQAEVNGLMGQIYYFLGDYRQAMEYLQQAFSTLQGERRYQSLGSAAILPAVRARAHMVVCCGELGRFADGVAYGAEALQLAEGGNRPYDHLYVSWRVGRLQVGQGTLHAAIPLLERAVALGQEADLPLPYRNAAAHLALAYALAGRVADALAVLGQVEGKMTSLVTYGEAHLHAGDVEEAHRLAQRGLENARHRKRRGDEARALWLLGEIAMQGDPPDVAQATAHYQQALALAEELGIRPLVAHCHHGLGRLYSQMGRAAQARRALDIAIEMYRAMDMGFYLQQAETALAEGAEQ